MSPQVALEFATAHLELERVKTLRRQLEDQYQAALEAYKQAEEAIRHAMPVEE